MSENDSVDEIHTEGMKQQEIASIDQLSDGKSFLFFGQFLVTPVIPDLFLICVRMIYHLYGSFLG